MAGNPFSPPGTEAGHELRRSARGGLAPARLAESDFLAEAQVAFRDFVAQEQFPCVGARAALNSESFVLATYDTLGSEASTAALAADLYQFTQSEMLPATEYATFVAVFRGPEAEEVQFERFLWQQLAHLNRADAAHFEWDSSVRADPADPQFSFSFAGQALYVIGLHPQSSRLGRRFRWPALIFNPHEQFERLKADGNWRRMQHTIRERDLQLQGSINPMLSDFGERTEARQYSGRAVEENWRAPFTAEPPAKCPFHH